MVLAMLGLWMVMRLAHGQPAASFAVATQVTAGTDAADATNGSGPEVKIELVPPTDDPAKSQTPDVPPATEIKRAPTTAQRVGITAVEEAMGITAPTGRNIPAGHVEGNAGDYTPDVHNNHYRGVKLQEMSGPSKVNGHAQATARIIYGNSGLAPGIDDVQCFTTNHWLGAGGLNTGMAKAPNVGDRRIFNASWIGGASYTARQILRRVDYLADHDDVIFVVGVNNGHDSAVPALLASAYNVISVGHDSGKSSGGYTQFEGNGRCKPMIVAPGGMTSFSTPVVTAICARLLEAADRMTHETPDATKSEVIRAVLLAGAEKEPTWKPAPGKALDEHLGAGFARFDQSLAILTAGLHAPGMLTRRLGWDFRATSALDRRDYRIDTATPMGEVSLLLTWNRRIEGRVIRDLFTQQPRWNDAASDADFDLRLYSLDAAGKESLLAESAGDVDNLEHIYLKELPAGRYRIEVTRRDTLGGTWDYALAWRIEPPSEAKDNADP